MKFDCYIYTCKSNGLSPKHVFFIMHSTTITSYKHYNSENKLALSLPCMYQLL